jgi:cytochrome c biogenesis protein CcmG/thiol:disulfide interchange protein DsbE
MESNSEAKWVDEHLAALNPDSAWQPSAARGLARFKARQNSEGRGQRRLAWALTVAAAGSVCILAFPSTRVLAQRCVAACVSETGRVSQLLWHGLGAPGNVSGARSGAPDFTLADASGNRVALSDFKGRVVLLNFWATWCNPCRVEIPWFAELQQTYGDRDFVVLGVSLDEDGWKSVKPYIDQMKITYRVMMGNDDIARLYGGVESLPTTLIIDRAGRIASTHVGLINKSDYETEIQALLAER